MKYDGSSIRKQRLIRGWTQETLAGLVHEDQSTISRLEVSGRARASAVKKVADALGLRMGNLIMEEAEKISA